MANFNFNKVILGGRLTAAPELKQTLSGVMVTQFTVAVNRRFGEKQVDGTTKALSDFIRVIAWRERAEFVCRYFGKGSSICVVGAIQTRSWTDNQGNKQYTTEVVADEISFVDAKGDGGSVPLPSDSNAPPSRGTGAGATASAPPPSYYTPEGGNTPQFETISGDDELPF